MNKLPEYAQETVVKAIKEKSSLLSPSTFLWGATGSVLLSLVLKFLRKDHDSLFVGHWAPTLLLLGLYSKLTKQDGANQKENNQRPS